ncbi:MAG: 4-(cytidine 5'-diphospho)-2-C-methyl-D-erythritol kinase [Holosporales bacterium]|jgi:4-diphosphocytidyl-2-C-methyl-D-erythritol kinase
MNTVTLLCPAKINLWLHVMGRRSDGYHLLDSGVVFADWGDILEITPGQNFHFIIDGDFASQIPVNENNSVVKAWRLIEHITKTPLSWRLRLEKNIPVGAGLGGGSSDAAAVLRFASKLFPEHRQELEDRMISLGADVPVCYYNKPARMRGIGEAIETMDVPFDRPALLLWPNISLATASVYAAFHLGTKHDVNDLFPAACSIHPELRSILAALQKLPSVLSAGMSGSGSAFYAIFNNQKQRETSLRIVNRTFPSAWVKKVSLSPSTNG